MTGAWKYASEIWTCLLREKRFFSTIQALEWVTVGRDVEAVSIVVDKMAETSEEEQSFPHPQL